MSKIKSLQDIANKYPAASLGKRANLLEIKKDIAQALKDTPDQEIKNIIIALSDIYRKMPEGDSKLVLAFMMANIQSEKPHKYIDKIIEIHEKNEERKKQRDKEEGEKKERERAERVRREQEEEARAQAAAEEKQRQEDEKKANKGKRRRETKQGRKDTAKDFGSRFYNKDKKTDTNNQQNTNNNQQNNNQNRGQQNNNQNRGQQNRQQRNTGNNQQNTNNNQQSHNQQNTQKEQEKQYNYHSNIDNDIAYGMPEETAKQEAKTRFRILIRLVHPDKSRGDEKLEKLLNQISKDLNNINGMKDVRHKLQYLRNFEKVHKDLLEKLRNQNTNNQQNTKQEEEKKKEAPNNKEQQTKETLKDKTIEVQGQKIPAMGFGLRTIGTDNKAKEIIHNAIKNGYTSFDTAQEYGNEEILAEQVQKSGIARDKFFITSKLSPSRHVYGGRNFSQEIFYKKIQQTAKQMGGYIDIMMIHSWLSNEIHRHMAYDALIQAKKEGLIKNIGVSNYTGEQLQDAIKYLGDKGEKILVNQVEASVFLKDKINMRQNAAVCTKEDIAIVAYSPLRGIEQLDDPNNTLHKTHIDEIAKKHNITRAQVALAYLANIGYIVIPSSTNPKRQQENLQTPIIKLTPEEIKSLEEISIVTGEAQNNIEYFNNK